MLICEKDGCCVDCPITNPETAEQCDHAIEVEPVRRGRWVVHTRKAKTLQLGTINYHYATSCEVCHFKENRDLTMYKRCPNCGAIIVGRCAT